MKFSRHAEQRLRQRGKRESDCRLVVQYGTETAEGFFLRHRDVESAIRARKMEISRLEHLRGCLVVTDRERRVIVTVYHADTEKQRRLLRTAP